MSLTKNFFELESVFNSLDDNIELKIKHINKRADIECENINRKYQSLEQYLALEQGLNDHREVLLKILHERLEHEVLNVNEFYEKLIEKLNEQSCYHLNLYKKWYWESVNIINEKRESIKNNFIYFNKKNCTRESSTLVKYKFSDGLEFFQIAKYSKFLINEKKFEFNLSRGESIGMLGAGRFFFSLPLNRALICVKLERSYDKILVIDQNGNFLYSKDLGFEYERESQCFQITSSNIIRLYHIKNRTDSNIEIYNFRLELIHSIKLKIINCHDLIVNKNEIGLKSVKESKLIVFNINSLKFNTIQLQNKHENGSFYIDTVNCNYFINFNTSYFYFIRRNRQYKYDMIYIIERNTGRLAVSLMISPRLDTSSLVFDNYSNIYVLENELKLAKFYKFDGQFLFNIDLNNKIEIFFFTIQNSIIYNSFLNQKRLKFYEY